MNAPLWVALLATIVGLTVGGVAAFVPGLHVSGVIAVALVLAGRADQTHAAAVALFAVSAVTSFAVLNAIPAIVFGAPDESQAFAAPAANRLRQTGRAHAAVMSMAAGSALALGVLPVLLSPWGRHALFFFHRLLSPYLHVLLWCAIAFAIQSQIRCLSGRTAPGLRAKAGVWFAALGGAAVFLMCGLLGLFAVHAPGTGAGGLLPAMVGLFTLPGLLGRTLAPPPPAPPHTAGPPLRVGEVLVGGVAGLAGLAVAFVPGLTAGVGAAVAGAWLPRSDRLSLISAGAAKVFCIVAGALLFFVPECPLVRGQATMELVERGVGTGGCRLGLALCVAMVSGGVALLMLNRAFDVMTAAVERVGPRRFAALAGTVALVAVGCLWGGRGLAVSLVATAIGLLPALFGLSRVCSLGLVLVPAACRLSGMAGVVSAWLGW